MRTRVRRAYPQGEPMIRNSARASSGRGGARLGRALVVMVGLIAAAACGSGVGDEAGEDAPRLLGAGPGLAERRTDSHAQGQRANVDPGLRAAYVRSRQEAAGADFAVVAEGDRLIAHNTPHGFVATFARDGLVLTERVAEGDVPSFEARIRVDALGCPTRLMPLGADDPRALGSPQENRVEQAHGSLSAWYLNGPLGLEQGFDVAEPPSCLASEGRLTIALAVDGLTPRLGTRGEIELADAMGSAALRYAGLYVADARGTSVPAALRVDGPRVLIDVDAETAEFPLAIDPMWSQQAKLTASDAAEADAFGLAVSVSGDTAIVGAHADDDAGELSGSAYVFVRSGATWTEEAKLAASDAAAGDQFGYRVSVSEDTALVGAQGNVDAGASTGSAYVFVRNGTTWSQQAKLAPSGAAAYDYFGSAVSVEGDTALVGAYRGNLSLDVPGSVYVFARSGTTWSQQAELKATGATTLNQFGGTVSLSGSTALVGASWGISDGIRGLAYVFVRNGTSWSLQATLAASDRAPNDVFGARVSLSGDTALVSAYGDDDAGSYSGSAYVFARNGATWAEEAKLTASDAAADDLFGASLSLSGNTAVVGAPGDDDGALNQSGSAYVFVRSGTTWTEDFKLRAGDVTAERAFGNSVSLSGDTALVGAPWDEDGGYRAGAAYVFAFREENGSACSLDANCNSGFCRDGVCCDSDCGAGVASDCQSCLAAQTGQAIDGTCDAILSGAHTCRPGSGDACDPDELCDGNMTTCPDDAFEPSTTVCRAGSGDVCDLDELCPGAAGAACPADIPDSAAGCGTCADGACDTDETPPTSAADADEGCGCALPGRASRHGHATALLLLLGLACASRKRRPATRGDRGR